MQKQVEHTKAIRTKYPEQVVIAIARDSAGRANPITLGWTMIVSGKPAMMAIAVASKHYSTECIRASRCFVISYPSEDMGEAALFFGSRSGRNVDKFAEFECATEPAVEVDSVILSDAAANFECVLESELEAGDHVVFVGRIVRSHVNVESKGRLYTVGPGHKLGAVSSRITAE